MISIMNETEFLIQLNKYVSITEKMNISGNKILHGLFSGIHKSPYFGFGADFEDNRQYNYGDNLKLINWSLWGRTEKLFVKRFKEETNSDIYIILDNSLSMNYPDLSLTKFDMAKTVAALLGIIFFNQLDRVGFFTISKDHIFIKPARGEDAKFNFINLIKEKNISKNTDFSNAIEFFSSNVHRRSIIILISDFIFPLEELSRGLNHLTFEDHLIIAIKVNHKNEIDPAFYKGLYFDPENPTKKISVSGMEKKNYLKNLIRWNEDIKNIFLEKEIIYHYLNTNDSMLKFFTKLQQRSKR